MAKKSELKNQDRALSNESRENTAMSAPSKLLLMFTIVNRDKAEFYADILQGYEVNMQMILAASGTASTKTLELLGLVDMEKSVILSIIKKDKSKDALAMLEDKFKTVKNGKGIAYTVPLSSTVGVAIYQFLSNTTGGLK